MGVARKKGNADYEKGYRLGYANGYEARGTSIKREKIKNLSNLVEVVRCENCIYNAMNTDGATEPWCTKFGYEVEFDGYCNYGEEVE